MDIIQKQVEEELKLALQNVKDLPGYVDLNNPEFLKLFKDNSTLEELVANKFPDNIIDYLIAFAHYSNRYVYENNYEAQHIFNNIVCSLPAIKKKGRLLI